MSSEWKLGGLVLGGIVLLLVLSGVSSAFGVVYMFSAMFFVIGVWIAVLVSAFRNSMLHRVLTFLVQFYAFY